jgi:hypothetical protein
MPRRALIAGALTALVSSSHTAAAQGREPVPTRQRAARIGALAFGSFETRLDRLRDGLRELGYVERRDFVLEPREAGGRQTRLAGLARELVFRP